MRSDQDCPKCDYGVMVRYKTKTQQSVRTRYLKCDHCGHHGRERFIIKTNRRGQTYFCPLTGTDYLDSAGAYETMGVIYHERPNG